MINGHTPVEEANSQLVAAELRALRAEVRGGFDLLTNRFNTVIDDLTKRVNDHERRLTAIEKQAAKKRKRKAKR